MIAPRPSRRRVLAAVPFGGALALGAPVLAGCTAGDPAPPPPDPLAAVAERARDDTGLAEAVAAAHPALAGAARAVATDRRAHAAALRVELRRAQPTATPANPSVPAPPVPAPPEPAPPDPVAARTALTDALRAAQDEATALLGPAPGYRAGLLGSIAACCASHQAVLQ